MFEPRRGEVVAVLLAEAQELYRHDRTDSMAAVIL